MSHKLNQSKILLYLVIQLCFQLALADSGSESKTRVPTWARYPIFVAGLIVLLSVASMLSCCCCVMPKVVRFPAYFIILGGIGAWGYVMLGPPFEKMNQE